jgi:hypothetical protein
MAEKAIEMIKYLPEVFGYFQGKKNIKNEVDRLRNQEPIKQDRLQMDAALQNLNRAGNTTQTSVAQEGLERGVQQALANNPRNVNQLLDKLATGSAKISESDARQRNAINAQATQGNQMLNARNSAIDRSNLIQDRMQEERVAGAEAAKNTLNMKGLSTLGSILGDSVGLLGNGSNLKSGMYDEPLGTTEEDILDAFATEKRAPLSIADMTLDESELQDISFEEEDIPLDFVLPKRKSAMEEYMKGDGQFQFLENKGSYNEGGAVVTPEGYDHDGVDIDMRDAQTGKMVGKVESAEMIVNSDDTEKGIRLAKSDPNNPLSKWYLSLTKRFREEAKNRK